MSDFKVWAVVVGFATGLVCGVLGDDSAHAQDIWPMGTLEPPATAPLATVPAQPVAAATQPVAPIKPAALIPAVQQSTEPPLDQLVAPIALYPDPLLGQILMASTYTQEVAEAARWVRVPANRALGGDALTAALKAKGWNPSVMALAPFPSLLAIMADKLDWTQQLGKAFLARQGDVMAAVQRLRHAALTAGNLKATPQCHCVIRTSGDIISIQPAEAELVSIPAYDPAVVYGKWAEAAYPLTAFPMPPGFVPTPGTPSASVPRSRWYCSVRSGVGERSTGQTGGFSSMRRATPRFSRVMSPLPAVSGCMKRRRLRARSHITRRQ